MKILIATDNFLPRWDGISRFLSEIIPRLKEHEITVVCPDYGTIKFKDAKIIQFPLSKKSFSGYQPSKFNLKKMNELVAETDLVFNQTIGPIGFAAFRAARKQKKPIIGFIHSIEWELFPKAISKFKKLGKSITRKLARYMYKRYNTLLVPNQGTAEVLLSNNIYTRKRVVPLGVDTKQFKPGRSLALRKKLGIKPSQIVIGNHGRLAPEKDTITLLRAFSRLRKKYKNVKLLFVGEIQDKKLGDLFKNQKEVIIIPRKTNIAEYVQAFDIYCLTSLTETTSLTTLEAMACGKPVIVTDAGMIKDYVIDSYNGLFIPKEDPLILFNKLVQLIEDKELREKMGKEAREDIQEFDWDLTTELIKGALLEL